MSLVENYAYIRDWANAKFLNKEDQVDLSDYYTKSEIDSAIGNITEIKYVIVSSLPITGATGTIYLIKTSDESQAFYDEYIY